MASGHGEVTAQPGVQDQPERSAASTDKLITNKRRSIGGPTAISGAVAGGQPEAPLKSIAVRENSTDA